MTLKEFLKKYPFLIIDYKHKVTNELLSVQDPNLLAGKDLSRLPSLNLKDYEPFAEFSILDRIITNSDQIAQEVKNDWLKVTQWYNETNSDS
jgi:hypothetical protein